MSKNLETKNIKIYAGTSLCLCHEECCHLFSYYVTRFFMDVSRQLIFIS
jgi:hypothetical protein